jgi:mersacidin/lichenicidin family type 2 lantibiotic
VSDKTFAYLSVEGEPFSIGCKLPHSGAMALNLPFAEPTPYGQGKSGRAPPITLLEAWIDESYRAQAPKQLVALLPAGPSGEVEPSRPVRGARPVRPKPQAR